MKTIADKRKSVINRLSLIDLEILEQERKEKLAIQRERTFLKELKLELYPPPDDVIYSMDKSSVVAGSGYDTEIMDKHD